VSSVYFYFLLSLQSWIFSIKYLDSAIEFSLKKQLFTHHQIKYIYWIGIISFTSTIIALWFLLIVTFPGYYVDGSFDKVNQWNQNTYEPILFCSNMIWLSFNIASTIFTVFAILKIFDTVKELRKTNTKINLNSRTMILHCVVLIFNCFILFFYCVPYSTFSSRQWAAIEVMSAAADLIVQLTICFICLTMGKSITIRNYKMTLVVD
jgi:hypothetical protein